MPPLPKINSSEHINKLKECYVDKKMSTVEIEKNSNDIFGFFISRGTLYKEIIRNKISIRSKSNSISMAMSSLDYSKTYLNETILEWIDGFNLGDGYINFDKSRQDCLGARFCIGSTNEEWANYAMNGLHVYSPNKAKIITKTLDKKHPNPTWSSQTPTHPDIVQQAKRWYPNGVKTIPYDVRITPTSLMLWYLGDGSISKSGISFFIRLATCAFNPDHIENILIPKLKSLGLNSVRDESKNDIRILSDSVSRFFDIIGKKSPISCYNYKFEYGDWMGLYRLADVVNSDQEKWRVQYMFKQGKLDCQKSPGGRLILFNNEQKQKIRAILDNHIAHEEYTEVHKTNNGVKVSSIVSNDIERWNARYLITRGIVKAEKSMLSPDQALLLKEKLSVYGDTSAIPEYMINQEFRKYREIGFPYYKYSDAELRKKYYQIKKSLESENKYYWDGFGCELANYFHPHMFECRKKDKLSPIEFFNSDVDFKRGISKLIALYPKITESKIREICSNEMASSRINNFPPRVMISILRHFFDGQKITMFDPCSGFSGRLIGACASNLVSKYIGIDLSDATYNGLIKTKEFLATINDNFAIDLYHGNCIEKMQTYRENVDFVFTSPPFLDEEKYKNVEVETDYEKWKIDFVDPFIRGTHRILKNNGIMAVYTEAIRRNDFPFDFESIAIQCGYTKLDDIWFTMPCRENLRRDKTSRKVKIIAFKKS